MSDQADISNQFQAARRDSIKAFDAAALTALLQPAPCNRFYIQSLPDRATIVFGAVGPVSDTSNNPVACSALTASVLVGRQLAVDLAAVLIHILKISKAELAESRGRNTGLIDTPVTR